LSSSPFDIVFHLLVVFPPLSHPTQPTPHADTHLNPLPLPQEEDRIIIGEVSSLKAKLKGDDSKSNDAKDILTNKKRAKEFLVRLMYVEMLGHDGSFGYIKVRHLASLSFSRRTHLTVSPLLSSQHRPSS
jgi:hypothetical protein